MTREEVVTALTKPAGIRSSAEADKACEQVLAHDQAQRERIAAFTYAWTTEKPTEAGWYWWRLNETDNEPVIVRQEEIGDVSGEWAGPIRVPEEGK